MSTIGSGVLGLGQGQAPAKGKAGHGNATGADDGGFASAVATLSGREEDAGRKGGRLSISGLAGRGETDGENARVTPGRGEGAALAEGLLSDGAQAPDGGLPFEEEAAALLDAASRPGRKVQGEGRDGGKVTVRNPEEPASDDAEATADTAEAAPAGTDVGNLLNMLAAPKAAPHAVIHGAAANAGAVEEAKAQVGGKGQAKGDVRADTVAAKADASQLVDAADAGDVPQSDADQLFRLVRADGKGRDLDMSLSGEGDRAAFRDATPTGAKGETVTVVDARRYIGLAQTGNAGAVTTAITQDPQWAASLSATGGLSQSEAAATGKVVNTLKIQMHPVELGLVTATLRLHGDDLVVSLQVETGEAYRQLTDDQDAIVRALRGQGFAVDQVTVQLSPADRSANAQQGDSQGQQQQFSNPQAREGGNGRQGGGGEGTRNFGREETSHEGNTSDNASGLAGGQPQRTGGVYL